MDSPVGLGSVGEPVAANQQGECREGLQDRANPRKHRVQPDGKNKPAAGHSGLIAAICSDLQPKGLDAMTEGSQADSNGNTGGPVMISFISKLFWLHRLLAVLTPVLHEQLGHCTHEQDHGIRRALWGSSTNTGDSPLHLWSLLALTDRAAVPGVTATSTTKSRNTLAYLAPAESYRGDGMLTSRAAHHSFGLICGSAPLPARWPGSLSGSGGERSSQQVSETLDSIKPPVGPERKVDLKECASSPLYPVVDGLLLGRGGKGNRQGESTRAKAGGVCACVLVWGARGELSRTVESGRAGRVWNQEANRRVWSASPGMMIASGTLCNLAFPT
ncbi:hypothetical protein MYCTH_93272 [Thermothelomyces thermophilus ATCC 42464]|uniref:Uncharacterized protein n=1 Tax=Thermothelomyces thermophilus (strain ATCC 42464 / BCRC 31852 / DSM 1799) TaxID=573729 RepID=G2QB25_THET4|nr:uncharacterized protein MYCTH_93272 [Thermothelomyces thermophilus ATCC 42464]AEO55963.1 hypothetical protein MYCTH_93272 [Thermothelomyces thermophilus ATCC 42464]